MVTYTFDELAKALATGTPRREALKQALTVLGLVGSGATLSLAGAPVAAAQSAAKSQLRAAAKGCPDDRVQCGPAAADGSVLCCKEGTVCDAAVAITFACV
jgi:hypothetical protein